MTAIKYTANVGQKFNKDRSVHPFAGNTIICFVDPHIHPTIYNEAVWAQIQLLGMSCTHKFGFLPPSSFHMTVVEGLNDQGRRPERWSRQLPLDASLEEMDRFLIDRCAELDFPGHFKIGFKQMKAPATLSVGPINEKANRDIWQFRNQIADLTGIRRADFDDYKFHITLGYNLIELEPDEVAEQNEVFQRIDKRLKETFGVFKTASPMLTFFDDMTKFVPAGERLSLNSRQK
ncbi:MAG: hypothetical protein ACI85U_004328 [Candidatus Promineifilaceae bacterium]|jgi:hypothetical protein